MEVLNAVGSSAPSLLCKSITEKKLETKRSLVEFKLTKLAAVSSVLGASGLAKALTYEEALNQSTTTSSDTDITGILDGIASFATENGLIIGGGLLVLAVPLILSRFLSKPKNYEVVSAKSAYVKLTEDPNVQLLDIRELKDIRLVGSPDVRNLKKKVVAITYQGDDKQGFLKKLGLKFKDPENTTLVILDKFDGESELVAELVTLNGFKAAYAIRDGAEGPRGWLNSGLPWLSPSKGLAFDFSSIADAFAGLLGVEDADGLSVTLALSVAAGLGVLSFKEMETVLELLGSAALVQWFTKKFLNAKDRKVTLQQLDEFLNKKVAPKEIVDDLKMIGKALLPVTSTKANLPAPEEIKDTSPSSSPAQSADTVLQAEANSVPNTEVKEETIPATPRPLSPYPSYPDFKPPSSPSPSAP